MKKRFSNYDGESMLLKKLAKHDNEAFTMLFQAYWPLLLRLAGNYINDGDTCKEIVQDLFVSLYARRNKLTINHSLSSYLYVCLRNKIRNYLRNQSIYRKHIGLSSEINYLSGEITHHNNNVEQFINLSELQKKIMDCLNKMPLKCKEVYMLHYHYQYKVKIISGLLQRPVDTVDKQLRKAVRLLRNYLVVA